MEARESARPRIGVFSQGIIEHRQEQWLGSVDAAKAFDCDLILFPGHEIDSPELFVRQCNAIFDLASRDCLDALTLWTTSLELFIGHARMEELARSLGSLPIVSVEGELGDAPVVIMDNVEGFEELIDHLVDHHGHRRFAFLRGPTNSTGGQSRFRAFIEHLDARGIAVDPALISEPPVAWLPELAAEATTAMLQRCGTPPDVIMAANDDLAVGAINALEELGLAVPRDICVTGFDGVVNLRSKDMGLEGVEPGIGMTRRVNVHASTPSLTTLRAPFYELGWRSVELAAALARGDDVPRLRTVPTTLAINRSCGCFPAPRGATTASTPWADNPVSTVELARRLADILRGDLRVLTTALPAGWPERLATEAIAEVGAPGSSDFLAVLDEYLRATVAGEESLRGWGRTLVEFQKALELGADTSESRDNARTLSLQIQALLRQITDWVAQMRHQASGKRNQIIRDVGQKLITASTVEGVATVLAEHLDSVGIPSCYVALYAAPTSPTETSDRQPRNWARLLLAHQSDGDTEVAPGPSIYPSRWLVPGNRLDRDTPSSFVAQALFFMDEQLGFMLLEVGPRTGWIYEALQELTSSALQAALLVDRERRALTASEDAHRRFERTLRERDRLLTESASKTRGLHAEIEHRRRVEAELHRAHAELEQRVDERTAELATANTQLRHLVAQRRSAEEKKAALEARLRHAQKMDAIGRLAGGLAHDFNNLLVVINGNTDAVARRWSPEDPRAEELTEIGHAGARAATLTRQLLAFSRQQILHPQYVDLNDVVTGVLAMLHRLLGEDIELRTDLAEGLGSVLADVGQLEQIIVNLALNARDAMPEGGELWIATSVETSPPGREVRLQVRDNGVGMDVEVQARLFEPFFTTKAVGRGTGLGLATVFGIVEQSGGHVSVTSKLGAGTTFDIYLPRHETAPIAERPQRRPPSLRGAETILLAEDDPSVRGTVLRFLTSFGYTVLVAVDGFDALRVSTEHRGAIDLVITDIVMPRMGGRELADQLRHLRPETPILFVSGYAEDRRTTKGLPLTSWPLLEKPFTGDELARAVRESLDQGACEGIPASVDGSAEPRSGIGIGESNSA